MNSKALQGLKIFLVLIGVFHVTVGLGLNLWPAFPRMMAGYYGASFEWGPEFAYILKPLGAFMLVLGILAFAASVKPLSHAAIVYAFALLFALRALQRLIHQDELAQVFNIAQGRNYGNVLFFGAMAIALVMLLRAAGRGSSSKA